VSTCALELIHYAIWIQLSACLHYRTNITTCCSLLTFHVSLSIDPEDSQRVTDKTRKLGLVVVRGTQVSLVSPQDGVEEIANPFIAAEEE
jgi:hypothetical protein